MKTIETPGRQHMYRNITCYWLGFAWAGLAFGLLSQSCGSSNAKKAVRGPGPALEGPGGEAGETASGGSAAKSGSQGEGADGGSESGASGNAGDSSIGGNTRLSAAAGASGAAVDCPAGFGECDGDPSTLCEQSLRLVTSCGACNTECSSNNGTAACVDQKCNLSCTAGFGDCDNDPNNGCEAMLASNNENCGACGRNCAAEGATCMVDKCSAIHMQTVGNGSGTWAFGPLGALHLSGYYDVTRFPLDGSPAAKVWHSTNKTAGNNSLLIVDDEVYWSEWGVGGAAYTAGVFKKKITAPATDLPTAVFVPEGDVQFLRRQGNALYWASGDQGAGNPRYIYTRALSAPDTDSGAKIVSTDQGSGIFTMDVTSDAIYWVTQLAGTGKTYELRTVPLAGGTPAAVPEVFPNTGTPITTANANYIPSLSVKGNTVYFTRTVGDAQDGIYSYKRGDTKPTRLVSVYPQGLLLDTDFIYYPNPGLLKAPIAGGAGASIAPGVVQKLVGQDSKFVFYVGAGGAGDQLFKALK